MTNNAGSRLFLDGYNADSGVEPPAGLKAYWKLNELSGDALDAKGSFILTQNGTVPSAAGIISGSRGAYSNANYFKWSAGGSAATQFDKANFIVDGFFKTSTTGAQQEILNKHDGANFGWTVSIWTDNKLRFQFDASLQETTNTYADGAWHYFCCAMVGTGANDKRIYVDNAAAVQFTSGNFSASTTDLYMGLMTGPVGANAGVIDDVAYIDLVTDPMTWTEIEAFVAKRYNGGIGAPWAV